MVVEFEAVVRKWGPKSLVVTLPRGIRARPGQRLRLYVLPKVDVAALFATARKHGDTRKELRALRGPRD